MECPSFMRTFDLLCALHGRIVGLLGIEAPHSPPSTPDAVLSKIALDSVEYDIWNGQSVVFFGFPLFDFAGPAWAAFGKRLVLHYHAWLHFNTQFGLARCTAAFRVAQSNTASQPRYNTKPCAQVESITMVMTKSPSE